MRAVFTEVFHGCCTDGRGEGGGGSAPVSGMEALLPASVLALPFCSACVGKEML